VHRAGKNSGVFPERETHKVPARRVCLATTDAPPVQHAGTELGQITHTVFVVINIDPAKTDVRWSARHDGVRSRIPEEQFQPAQGLRLHGYEAHRTLL